MKHSMLRHFSVLFGLGMIGLPLGCGAGGGSQDDGNTESSWEALLDDGDASSIAPAAALAAAAVTPPPRYCPGDCARTPLAYWKLDDCNTQSTELMDSAYGSSTSHPAFRAVSAACVVGAEGQGVGLAGREDILYAPDQPDFIFDSGLTIAAWIKPDRLGRTQTIARKRFDGTSSFVLALQGKRLSFALRLSSGRVVGVSAPIQAGRFTHVAATYDGQQAILYLDGVAAAQTKASGKLAAGPGPIFIGNDADRRLFAGTVDNIWLNTLATPADQVMALTCIRQPPLLSLSPSETPPEEAGTPVAFDLALTNQGSASCPVDQFEWYPSMSWPLSTDTWDGVISAGPGETVHTTVNVWSAESAPIESYPFELYLYDPLTYEYIASARATYVVGSASSCVRQPPLVTLTPSETLPLAAGTTATFDLALTNQNGATCRVNQFQWYPSLPYPLTTDNYGGGVSVAPGETVHTTFNVLSSGTAPIGSYPVQYQVYDLMTYQYVTGQGSYVVGSTGTPPGGLPTPNGGYTTGSYGGAVWGASDSVGSAITLDPNGFCANGTAVQVPIDPTTGQPDWGNAWGALLGWNMNEALLPDNTWGPWNPADVSDKSSVTVQLSGAAGLNLRIQMEVDDPDTGTPAYFCVSIPSEGGTFPLTSLATECWAGTGVVFDPATMQPVNLGVSIVTSTGQAYPFNFCVTALSFQ
jgi:hypothetical protein